MDSTTGEFMCGLCIRPIPKDQLVVQGRDGKVFCGSLVHRQAVASVGELSFDSKLA